MKDLYKKRAKKDNKKRDKFNKFGKYNRKAIRVKQENELKAKENRIKTKK